MSATPISKESFYANKSNEQRLKSLVEYQSEKTQRRRLIKDAASSGNPSKHVQFDSDDDDDHRGKAFVQKKMQLFDDNDDNSEAVNANGHFEAKKIPKKRQKLQDLQARLTTTNDPRFQFSEQFLDERDQQEDEDEDDPMDREEISFEDEKKKSLAILDRITQAKPLVTKEKTRMIRFDPSKTEHRIYELGSKVETNGHQASLSEPKSILKAVKQTAPVIDSTRTYEFDQTKFKSMFTKASDATVKPIESGLFQFQFFKHEQPASSPAPRIATAARPIPNGKSKVFPNSSDDLWNDEHGREQEEDMDESEVAEPAEPIEDTTFFFYDIDARLKDGLESFVRTEDLNELERTWPSKRKEIAQALRTKHRKAIQRKDHHRVFNHRHRQRQHPPSSSSSSKSFSKSDAD